LAAMVWYGMGANDEEKSPNEDERPKSFSPDPAGGVLLKNVLSNIVKGVPEDGGVNPANPEVCVKFASGGGPKPNVSSKLSSEADAELFVSCGVLAFARSLFVIPKLPLLPLLVPIRANGASFSGDWLLEEDRLGVGRTPVMFTSLGDFG